jgi:catechol 2,3-dioxygenase-like lactoylglutathione lyase family enzyme
MVDWSKGGVAMSLLRISHPAFSGSRRDETLHFYRDVMGMETVLEQDNLDYPSEDHFFFHVGADNFIAYFLPKAGSDPSAYAEARPGSGWMDHLALDVESGSLDAWATRLSKAGVPFEGPIDRGYERSIYFNDPNGVTLELLAWITQPPPSMPLAATIRRAQELRLSRGAALVEDVDVRAAIAEISSDGDVERRG